MTKEDISQLFHESEDECKKIQQCARPMIRVKLKLIERVKSQTMNL